MEGDVGHLFPCEVGEGAEVEVGTRERRLPVAGLPALEDAVGDLTGVGEDMVAPVGPAAEIALWVPGIALREMPEDKGVPETEGKGKDPR